MIIIEEINIELGAQLDVGQLLLQ